LLKAVLGNLFLQYGKGSSAVLGKQTRGVTMGVGAATAIARLVLVAREWNVLRELSLSHGWFWWKLAWCKALRYVDDVRIFAWKPSDCSAWDLKGALDDLSCALWDTSIPIKPDAISPFVGLALCCDSRGYLTWFALEKPFGADGTRVMASDARPLLSLDPWDSWNTTATKCGVVLGILARAASTSSSFWTTCLGIVAGLRNLCECANYPKPWVLEVLRSWDAPRHHQSFKLISSLARNTWKEAYDSLLIKASLNCQRLPQLETDHFAAL
jgi:hypothetical protein